MTRTTSSYRLHLLLKTLTPMSIATPGEMRVDTNSINLQPVYGNPRATPCTAVQKLNVLHDNKIVGVPMIAANNIIGRLRRHAAKLVLDAIAAKGQQVSISTYSALTCGAVTGKPDGRDVTFQEYRDTRKHPYIGLMGGGPRMIRRHLRCFNAVPFHESTRLMFERTAHPYLDEAVHGVQGDVRNLMQRWILNRNDDLKDLVDVATASASVRDFHEEMQRRQTSILSDKSREEGEKKDRITTEAFTAIEFVVPGVTFPLSFELMDVDHAQLGLFLSSLDRFAAIERIGGYSRNGFGQMAFHDVVITDDQGNVIERNLFSNSRLDPHRPLVSQALQAWEEARQQLDADELDTLLAPPPVDAKDKDADKAGKGKPSKKAQETQTEKADA